MKIALMGAGGKMGCRIVDQLKERTDFTVVCVEVSEVGIERIRSRGLAVTPQPDALRGAEVVILAVPDILIGKVSREVVSQVEPGCLVIGLDPAAAFAGVVPRRVDVSFFVTHPCHPPLFNDETDPAARGDWFGGQGLARQDIVCALYAGREEHYGLGERLARIMYAPVRDAHRLTVEQMAILEPALVESFTATCVAMMKEALERAIVMGVPREAATAFLMGHVRIQFAVLFGYAGFPFSDGAKLALEKARPDIFKPDCFDAVFDIGRIRRSVEEITGVLERR